MSQPYAAGRGKLVVAESSERTADSRKPKSRRCFELVKFQKRAVKSMAVAEGATPNSAALRSGTCLRSLRFRQGKKQPLPKSACLYTRSEKRAD